MAETLRAPRGGHALRGRGSGRGGILRSKAANGSGSDSDSSRARQSQRGRGRGNATNNAGGTIQSLLQQSSRRQNDNARVSRGARSSSRGAARGGSLVTPVARIPNDEAPDQRYNRLKAGREKERKDAIAQGYLADPDKPRNLADAVTMIGTCQEMCSEFERARRIYQKDVWGPEMVTLEVGNGESKRQVDESKMVKKFQRSAAGMDEQLPSDLRPPAILLKTADYLFNDLLEDEDSLMKANTFIWDRTRAIRNDFSIQQLTRVQDIRIAIECYEKIARYHILSLHQIGGQPQELAGESYNWQQDREQLDKTLLSLLTYYDNVKQRYRSPNESEFRAYWIIFQIGNSVASVDEKVQTWSMDIVQSGRIEMALQLVNAAKDLIDSKGPLRPPSPLPIAQQNWQRFWNLVGSKQMSYLMSCVAEIGFNVVRRVVLMTISMSYKPAGNKKEVQDWTLDAMTTVLGFDDEDTTRDFLEQSNLTIETAADGTEYFKLLPGRSIQGLPDPTPELRKQFHSWRLVERKRYGRTFPAIIAGMPLKAARERGMMLPDWNDDMQIEVSHDEDGLFVTNNADSLATKPVDQPSSSILNPSASTFTPVKPSTAVNPFAAFTSAGSPTSNNEQQPKLSAFGQPSAFAPAPSFGKPTSAEAPATVPSPSQSGLGAFGAPPKSFSFGPSSPPAGESSIVATAASPPAAIENPFAGAGVTKAKNPFGLASNPSSQTPEQSSLLKPLAPWSPFSNPGTQDSAETPSKANPFGFSTSQQPSTSNSASPIGNVDSTPPTKAIFEFPNSVEVAKDTDNSPKPTAAPSITPSSPFTFPSIASTNTPAKPPEGPSLFPNALAAASPAALGTASSKHVQFKELGQPATQSIFNPILEVSSAPSSLGSTAAQPADSSSSTYSFSPVSSQVVAKEPINKHKHVHFPDSAAVESSVALGAPSKQPQRSSLSTYDVTRKANGLDYIAEQLMCDPGRGFFRQFAENIAHQIILDALQEEEKRKALEEANEFRMRTLRIRYGRLWKHNAARLKGRRRRAEMKLRSQEIRERNAARNRQPIVAGRRQSKASAIERDLDEFRRQREAEKQLAKCEVNERKTHQAQPDHNPRPPLSSFDLIGRRPDEAIQAPPSSTNNKSSVMISRGHKRSQTQPNVLSPHNESSRVSKSTREASPAISTASSRLSFGRSSFLDGGTLENGLPFGTKVSSMQSPYFRLKAAGFGPGNGVKASDLRGVKRARLSGDDIWNGSFYGNGIGAEHLTKRLRSPVDSSVSSPAGPAPRIENLASSVASSTSLNGGWKRDAEDDDLLARARKMREMLEEGESWYREEVAKDDVLRRSQELRRSQLGNRPGSQLSSPYNEHGRDSSNRPKFWARVSKFLPREEYGVRREATAIAPPKTEYNGQANGVNLKASSSRQMPPPTAPPANNPSKGGSSWDDAIEL